VGCVAWSGDSLGNRITKLAVESDSKALFYMITHDMTQNHNLLTLAHQIQPYLG